MCFGARTGSNTLSISMLETPGTRASACADYCSSIEVLDVILMLALSITGSFQPQSSLGGLSMAGLYHSELLHALNGSQVPFAS